jgi:hypothetical protein
MTGATTRMRDAVPLLRLITRPRRTPLNPDIAGDPALKAVIGVARTRVRLQKLDAWVRTSRITELYHPRKVVRLTRATEMVVI